jgi:transcriptional regulator with XRE-family HTH domain
MSLAKRLKELRKVKKISQRELAKILKISSGAVGMYETGKREPDYELLCKIADYFGVTTDYIFCRTDDPAPPQARKKEYSYEEYVLSAPSLDKAAIRISDGFPYSVHFHGAGYPHLL